MEPTTYCFRITRFKPGGIEPPRQQQFEVELDPRLTVLDGLENIRLTQDASLMYRHCCHHASCGTCACMINGTPALACATRLMDLEAPTIDVAPLAHLTCLGDLVVDMREFFSDIDADWFTLKQIRSSSNNDVQVNRNGGNDITQLENCIECGCCVAACPEMANANEFMGPAALAALNNERANRPSQQESLLKQAAHIRGADRCRRHLDCSRVCPSGVYPARHIADLQRAIQSSSPIKK